MVDGIFVFLKQYLIFGRGSGTIYQKINLSTGWVSYFCVTPLFETFWSGSLNWARFPLLSYSSPLLSPFLSSPLNWALFWAKLLNWALFSANLLVWALFWALKKAYLLLRARFWVVLLFWALKKALKRVKPLKIALKKALKLRHNLPRGGRSISLMYEWPLAIILHLRSTYKRWSWVFVATTFSECHQIRPDNSV